MQSYSQNLEDVLLNRCFKDQISGTYVDVGAGPGDGFSVTKNLYLQGWSGLIIEPISEYAQFHRKSRPRDQVIEEVVGNKNGEIEFVYFRGTGLSTKSIYVPETFKEKLSWETLKLPQRTLQSILDENDLSRIDLLKIDVEGAEMEVLQSIDFDKVQPRLMVVEATRPMSRIRVSDGIREYLVGIGYKFALFDGLNDYFVYMGEKHLMNALNAPVNVFDGDFFKIDKTSEAQDRIQELELKNFILDQQVICLGEQNEKLKLELKEQNRLLDWHRAHLYVLDNSIRMKIGTFAVTFLLPLKPLVVNFLAIFRRLQTLLSVNTNKHLRRIARLLLRVRVFRIAIISMRVTRVRVFGFWGWKNVRVHIKNTIVFFKKISRSKRQSFDAGLVQSRSGISQRGLGDIETHALETLERDLKDYKKQVCLKSKKISKVVIDVRCIQAPGLAARGIGKHANFIVSEIQLWASELNLEVNCLVSPEMDSPQFLNQTSAITVLPENTNGVVYFQLSSMTENPIPSLPILLNPNAYNIGIFYDFIPKHNPGYYLWGSAAKALYKANLSTLKLYDEFWAISNSVAGELNSFLRKSDAQQTKVIATGVSAKIPGSHNDIWNSNPTDVLIPTGGDARKDPLTALAALAIMKEQDSIENVVVIGHLPDKAVKELQVLVSGTWISPKLKFLAPTSFDDISLAYNKAKLTLVTSLDEGFSLPIVESISMRVPVLGSNIPAHRELLREEFLFKPKSYFRTARKIRGALKENRLIASSDYLNTEQLLIAEDRIAARLHALKSELVIDRSAQTVEKHERQASISVISPWPPLKSGIADYSESTLKDPTFDIVCSDSYKEGRVDVSSWNWCKIATSQRLFVLGNNHNFHTSAMYALMKMGGNALIHDTRILDMWRNIFGAHSYEAISNFISISRADFDNSFMNLDHAITLGFEPLIPSVHRFITHSELLKDHLKSIGAKRVEYIPFASRKPVIEIEKSNQNSSAEYVVGVFGITDISTKHFDLIYDVCAALVKEFPNLRLVCVGELMNDASRFLDQDNRRNASWIELKGRVADSEYWELMAQCQMTIHVRNIKRLSLSGAVMDSLTVGTPVVCTESILREMRIPIGLPYSESLGDEPDFTKLKTAIIKVIEARRESQPGQLANFAKSRDYEHYQRDLKAVLGRPCCSG